MRVMKNLKQFFHENEIESILRLRLHVLNYHLDLDFWAGAINFDDTMMRHIKLSILYFL